MKKIAIITAVFLLFSTGAFAQQKTGTGTLTLGGGTETGGATSDTLSMGLSSNVTAMYEDSDTVQTQWYAIATAHQGGTEIYATAQDVTGIYKLVAGKKPGDAPSFDGIPAASDESTVWSDGAWKAL